MPLRTFLPYDVLGAGAWAATFCVLGAVFWRSFDQVTRYVSRGLAGFALVVAIGLALYGLVRLRRDPELRERVRTWLREREDKPFMRPLVRLAGPAWRGVLRPAAGGVDATARFGAHRFAPGPLGLELTTLLSLAAVGGFAFAAIARVIEASAVPRLDRLAFDVVDGVRFRMLTDVVKVVTWLGAAPTTGAIALLTAGWALSRRRPREALALGAGYGFSLLGAHLAKAAFDRTRPPGALVHTLLSSFPSGHSLYAVTLVACAVVLVRAGAGWAVRAALVAVAVGAVAVIAATRVYLHAHYLTDVLAGVGLGTAIWSVIGAFTVFAGGVRHNGRAP
jgi:undecaprenyl-diphosphatase